MHEQAISLYPIHWRYLILQFREAVYINVDIARLYQLPDLFFCMLLFWQRFRLGLEGLCKDLPCGPLLYIQFFCYAQFCIDPGKHTPNHPGATTSHRSLSGTLLRRIQCDISINHVVTTDCLILENFQLPRSFWAWMVLLRLYLRLLPQAQY